MSNVGYKPAQIYAEIIDDKSTKIIASEKTDKKSTDKQIKEEYVRQIQVSSGSQIRKVCDRCRVNLSLSSCKETAADAKNSVNRRFEYIVQTLRNYGVNETDIIVSKNLLRNNNNNSPNDQECKNYYTFTINISATFNDIKKQNDACNLLVEKLGDILTKTQPIYFHSQTKIENSRTQLGITALRNATNKASEMAKLLNCQLGQPIFIKEIDNEEYLEDDQITAPVMIFKTSILVSFQLIPIYRKS